MSHDPVMTREVSRQQAAVVLAAGDVLVAVLADAGSRAGDMIQNYAHASPWPTRYAHNSNSGPPQAFVPGNISLKSCLIEDRHLG